MTVNRHTKPGRLRCRQYAANSTVMRATNPDQYQPQHMWMSSVTNQRTPTREEEGKTQTATRGMDVWQSTSQEQYMYQPCCFVLWWN